MSPADVEIAKCPGTLSCANGGALQIGDTLVRCQIINTDVRLLDQ